MPGIARLPHRAGFTCPACRTMTPAGTTDARLGFCPACRGFTGLCAAGRTIRPPAEILRNIIAPASWTQFCTDHGAQSWRISGGTVVLLCRRHSEEIRAGRVPWLDASPTAMTGHDRA